MHEGNQAQRRRAVGLWLSGVGALIFLMVIVGGATRLTESGLSITEWNLVTGVLPPLGAQGWEAEFAKYQSTDEFKLVNSQMSLAEFKTIYLWEWGHRLLGRVIGLAFLIPLIAFWVRGWIAKGDHARLLGLFGLIVLQGVIGWWMVKSGLSGRTDVSPYRLTVHLGLAFALFGLVMWVALDQFRPAAAEPMRQGRIFARAALALVGLSFFQILLGALVAGTNAGFAYNTWPLIDGRFVPEGYWFQSPWWRNLFETIPTVQFNHRIGGYLVFVAVTALWIFGLRLRPPPRLARMLHVLMGVTAAQVVIGILALVMSVPLYLGLLHQAGALLVFGAAVHLAHRARAHAPQADDAALRTPLPAHP